MKSLLEKIKSLDKKILIAAGAGIVLLIAIIIAVVAISLSSKESDKKKDDTKIETSKKEDSDKDKDSEKESEEEAVFQVKVTDAEGNPVAGVGLQVCKDSCVPATTDDTGVAIFKLEITEGYKLSVLTCPEGYEYTGEAEIALESGIKEYALTIEKIQESTDDTQGQQDSGQQPTTTNPEGEEILGAGSVDQPYLEIPNLDNMTVTTVSIPAGQTLYYGIQRVGSMILTINDGNAYVIESNGTRHDASGGRVSFTVESALPSDYVMFQIGNKGGSSASFTIQFSNPTGSYMNPTVISSMGSEVTINLAAGNEVGYYYKYIAETTGTIRFYMSATSDSVLYATNNRNSAQRSTEADVVTDEQGRECIELDVNQGDEIIINVGAKPNSRGKYAATTITWSGSYK